MTVLFSSVCDAVDQYSDQCNYYNDNGEMLEGCDYGFTQETQTQRTCEAAGCAANANTRRLVKHSPAAETSCAHIPLAGASGGSPIRPSSVK